MIPRSWDGSLKPTEKLTLIVDRKGVDLRLVHNPVKSWMALEKNQPLPKPGANRHGQDRIPHLRQYLSNSGMLVAKEKRCSVHSDEHRHNDLAVHTVGDATMTWHSFHTRIQFHEELATLRHLSHVDKASHYA